MDNLIEKRIVNYYFNKGKFDIAGASVKILHSEFKSYYLKNTINDYMENLGDSLMNSIPRYNELTKEIQKSLDKHIFKK